MLVYVHYSTYSGLTAPNNLSMLRDNSFFYYASDNIGAFSRIMSD